MNLHCYHCGASLAGLSLPLGRRDECPECTRSLHVCYMCEHYDPHEATKQCREDDAEEVRDKKASNYCEYFRPSETAYHQGAVAAEDEARKRLESLFEGTVAHDHPPEKATKDQEALENAEALFRK
jgi:hypothetical protein